MAQENKVIKSGWKGHLNGCVESTNSHVEVSQITLKLDRQDAYALCNLLIDSALETACYVNDSQRKQLSILGAAIGRMIDHNAANNGGVEVVKA